MRNSNPIFQKLGPGLLYAGAAIGVSHLVQSTRAGASFGLSMLVVVVIANVLKYPFFQYGPRYAAATGNSLLDGYKKLGDWAIWLFFLLTLGTMFIIQGAITMVTAGLAKYITGIDLSLWIWMLIITALAMLLLGIGKLKVLDKFMKVVMVILAITTIAAAVSSIFSNIPRVSSSAPFSFFNKEHLYFLIAFIGWMPAPIDISVWYSVWSKDSSLEGKPSDLKSGMFDFSIGYWGTAFLALCFVLLGAFMLHNTGIELSSSAVVFSGQIIEAYARSLGNWSIPIISIAAFTTMLSTTISVMDGLSRVMKPTVGHLFKSQYGWNTYPLWLIILGAGTLLLVWVFGSNMKALVDFATTLSFLTAPILAYLNIRVIQSKEVSPQFKPSNTTQVISYIGLIVLTLFSLLYMSVRFI